MRTSSPSCLSCPAERHSDTLLSETNRRDLMDGRVRTDRKWSCSGIHAHPMESQGPSETFTRLHTAMCGKLAVSQSLYLRVNGIMSKRFSISLKNAREVFIFRPYVLLGSRLYTVVLWPPSLAWRAQMITAHWNVFWSYWFWTAASDLLPPCPLQCWWAHPLRTPRAPQTPPPRGPFCKNKALKPRTALLSIRAFRLSELTSAGPSGFGWWFSRRRWHAASADGRAYLQTRATKSDFHLQRTLREATDDLGGAAQHLPSIGLHWNDFAILFQACVTCVF